MIHTTHSNDFVQRQVESRFKNENACSFLSERLFCDSLGDRKSSLDLKSQAFSAAISEKHRGQLT